jgi:hypothetical protein
MIIILTALGIIALPSIQPCHEKVVPSQKVAMICSARLDKGGFKRYKNSQ